MVGRSLHRQGILDCVAQLDRPRQVVAQSASRLSLQPHGLRETSGHLDDLMTAIDRFEAAVISRGGDLLVNTPYSNPPENPDFVIPAPAVTAVPVASGGAFPVRREIDGEAGPRD